MSDYDMKRVRGKMHRLINSRFPTVDVFESYVDEGPDKQKDLEFLFELEQATNPRLAELMGRLQIIPHEERVFGEGGASIVMAAFIHSAKAGGRFNDRRLGAWYASRDIKTAFDETVYHNARRLEASEMGFASPIQVREYVVGIDMKLLDVRDGEKALYDPNNYAVAQSFSNDRRWPFADEPVDGLIYDSVRRKAGENICIFRPKAVPRPLTQGGHFQYDWDKAGAVTITQLQERRYGRKSNVRFPEKRTLKGRPE